MFEILPETHGRIVGLKASGKLTHEDYQAIIPELEKRITEEGKLHVLVILEELHMPEMSAMWDELKFDAKHGKDFDRCAIVGDRKWEKWMVNLSKPFFPSNIKYFDAAELDKAWEWLKEDL
ncbi:hypothetical protein Pan216_55540 [Planctomycetes bacterium Pan216]|uniref:SpoIIAA-like protein n=1 Tax=Kolteria novifilia TaxID=2527975 RepID=A0A518BCN6_9BACT|nr:hypothetical protein Pan216_55540 [Planctomycetes bacterium Pan216]